MFAHLNHAPARLSDLHGTAREQALRARHDAHLSAYLDRMRPVERVGAFERVRRVLGGARG